MSYWLELLFAAVLLAVGLRLSAFFSGGETGFYRLSIPRLTIDARAGDKAARRLLWFAHHPAYFVATCLIGNNVANYLCTAAIGVGVLALFGKTTHALEIGATLVMSPVIFQFGELLPKTLYYLAPLSRLRKDIRWFRYFFRLFFVFSWPLVLITRLFERISGQAYQTAEAVLGRSRLAQLMHHGHREGVLTEIQSRMANGLLQFASQPVTGSIIPASRVLGVEDTATRLEMIDFARQFGVTAVAVHRTGDSTGWYGYALTAELIWHDDRQPIIHPMPLVSYQTSKLETLYRLQSMDAWYGAVKRDGQVLGVVARNGLIEQIFRPER
jgi:putative hemolysin